VKCGRGGGHEARSPVPEPGICLEKNPEGNRNGHVECGIVWIVGKALAL
jgi:hypothetical protein